MSPRKKAPPSQALVPVAAPVPAPARPGRVEEGEPGDMAQADLEALTDIFTRYLPTVTVEEARLALKRTLTDHRQQLAAFLVAVSKSKLSRLVRLLNAIDTIENTVLSPERLKAATMTELTKLWAVAQGAAQMDLDLIKNTADGGKNGGANSSSTTIVNVVGTATEATLLDGYGLDGPARARVRDILTSFLVQMGKTGVSDE